ncbi:MAG: aconitate hydratase AcnA, partial [Acidisphaera sp.]|nr:aconitate hydratase AcnA [Acidisphaera sp.]
SPEEIRALAAWSPDAAGAEQEVAFYPARVLMPDSSGVPLLVDLAALRDAVAAQGLDPRLVDPRIPTDLVIDHSVAVDYSGSPEAITRNMEIELRRNRERYGVVRWAAEQYGNLRVIPPGNGILHQINVEYLATVVASTTRDGETCAFPDTLLGMDSHTPMVNGIGVFGWGVGGIEAATALLGQPVGMLVPRVVGCRVTGALRAGVVATDVVLRATQLLRAAGVLGAIVEFFGPGLGGLGVPDRVTLANMAPEYGATMGFFPVDQETVRYLALTARPPERVALVEAYARAQGLWREADASPDYAETVEFDLASVEPSMAGPSRPEDRVPLAGVPASFRTSFAARIDAAPPPSAQRRLTHGDIVIAAITSCTNTSNPYQMIAAGLLARNAVSRGLRTSPWVKTSLSPGSRVITGMLERAGLLQPLEALGFHIVGYGCMTCGGGAGPLPPEITEPVAQDGLVVVGVISGNRNFEGRLHPTVRGTYLASPPLVIAAAIAGSVLYDLEHDALGTDGDGRPVFLADLWPSEQAVRDTVAAALTPDLFRDRYTELADGGPGWAELPHGTAPTFDWDPDSLYLKRPPFLDLPPAPTGDVRGARTLLLLGDNITTDHISPGGAIPPTGSAGQYLLAQGVAQSAFHTYVARRANHEVMVRGTFGNIRLRNEMAPEREGGFTRHLPDGEIMTVFDAATAYQREGVPLVVVAGSNYGCGSSRDWAAKGTRLLGIRAVLAESFERIHRSNLVGMGVIPLQFPAGTTRTSLQLDGSETIDLIGDTAVFHRADGSSVSVSMVCRVDTRREAEWVRHGGILPYVLQQIKAGEGGLPSRPPPNPLRAPRATAMPLGTVT